ncbi:hypothetical protein SLS62_003511 [Diatrype stigma]|uniref:WW domain-containing protein n=1 Tax=Diatrype stigma TaxID=117547 RepID=A0AAN9YRB6_9PEZI
MLKSTYKPSPNVLPPLPPGWTEHKAPTGHTYFYNANTKESTYKRPGVDFASGPGPQQSPQPPPHDPNASYFQYSSIPNLSNPAAANAFLAQYDPARQRQQQEFGGRGGRGGGHHRGGHGHGGEGRDGGGRPRPQPADKPRSKVAIPGCEPWILVYTKYGRRFVYNPVKNASYWRIPEKVMKGILELDIQGIKEKAGGGAGRDGEVEPSKSAEPQTEAGKEQQQQQEQEEEEEELGSDYEEVEVTDDEGEEGVGEGDGDGEVDQNGEGGHRAKRQRTEDPDAERAEGEDTNAMPVEFNEEDIAYQLQAMGADYGLDPGEYDDGHAEEWPEGAEGNPLSEADAIALFEDLLDDHGINPYSPWEKLLEEGRVFDDPRYTALATTKARREAWEAWSRSRIRALRERRAREAKERPPDDPRVPFFAFLHEKATSPKLYWPEFRRKHRREPVMRDSALSDRDRERWYRDHVARLRLPLETRKKDLAALLRSVPLRLLNRRTDHRYRPQNQSQNQNQESEEESGGGLLPLPAQVLTDVRFISLDTATRDPLVQAFIQTLPGPPAENEEGEVVDEEGQRKKQEEKRKREKALEERERVVAEEKRRQRRLLEQGRAALREEEREIERAMQVGKKGLQSQLEAAREKEREREEREREQALAREKARGEGDTIAEEMDTGA